MTAQKIVLHTACVDKEPNAPFSLRGKVDSTSSQVIKALGITVVRSFQLNESLELLIF